MTTETELGSPELEGLSLTVRVEPTITDGVSAKDITFSVPVWHTSIQTEILAMVDTLVTALKLEGYDVTMKTTHKTVSTVRFE